MGLFSTFFQESTILKLSPARKRFGHINLTKLHSVCLEPKTAVKLKFIKKQNRKCWQNDIVTWKYDIGTNEAIRLPVSF